MPPSNPTRRFLILTGDAGFGHRSAAKSVAAALEEEYGCAAVTCVVDPVIERPSPFILRKTQTDYDETVIKNQDWYRFTYTISDSRTASTFVESALTMLLYKNLLQLMDEFRPDAILTTHHMFNAPLGSVLYTRQLNIPFFTVVTDLANVHSLWFHSSPDHFFVGSEAVKEQALQHGIATEKVTFSGIPVDPRLARPAADRTHQREAFALDPTLPTLLFVGSRRVNGILECLEALESCGLPLQALVAAGGDEPLCRSITERTWNFPLHCERYVQNLPDWMNCADVLITKAGGLIVSEGLAAGLPILLIDNLPGQEDGNVSYVTDHAAGLRIQQETELPAVIECWFAQDRAELKVYAANSAALGRASAASEVAKSLWQASLDGIPHRHTLLRPTLRSQRIHEQQHLD